MNRRNHLRYTHSFTWAGALDWTINITRSVRVGQLQDMWRGHSPSLPPIWLLLLLISTALVILIRDIMPARPREEQVQGLRRRLHLRARQTEEPVQGLRRRLHLRAQQPTEEQVQGLRRRLHLRARPREEVMKRARFSLGRKILFAVANVWSKVSPRGALNLPAARRLQTERFDPLE